MGGKGGRGYECWRDSYCGNGLQFSGCFFKEGLKRFQRRDSESTVSTSFACAEDVSDAKCARSVPQVGVKRKKRRKWEVNMCV